MSSCTHYTISQGTDLYLQDRSIDHKKYFNRFLTQAERVYVDLFRKTLFIVKNVWKTVKDGDPFPYVDIPKDCTRLLSASVTECDLIEPLFYNSQLNILPKPQHRDCGCNHCECGGLCNDVNNFTQTTNLLFTINGQNYYEIISLEYCKNGDILENRQVPAKKYNNYAGDGGDYNDDDNNDYSHVTAPFSDYTIVTENFTRKLCKLETLPCGCPKETPENQQMIFNYCGCYLGWNGKGRTQHKKQFFQDVNNNRKGEVKISECGTKLYYKPQRKFQNGNNNGGEKIPRFLLLAYQTDGTTANQESLFPEFALETFKYGIDYFSKRFNDRYPRTEKHELKCAYEDSKNDLILFLNPLSIKFLQDVQDAEVRW